MPIHPQVAHQYGWDEAILFVIPIVVAVIVIRSVERRKRRDDDRSDDGK